MMRQAVIDLKIRCVNTTCTCIKDTCSLWTKKKLAAMTPDAIRQRNEIFTNFSIFKSD